MIRAVTMTAAAVLAFASVAQAQQPSNAPYPNRQITLVVSSAPGGSADFGARMYAEIVQRSLGQRIVVENRQGANGILAAEYLRDKAPDGYTLMQGVSGLHEISPGAQQLPFDPNNDFTLITPLTTADNFLIVRSDLGINSVKELVEKSKMTAKGFSFGDTTVGAPPHLMMEQFKLKTGANIEIVHYRASQALLNDMIAGRIDISGSTYNAVAPAFDVGKVKMIAINRDQRSKRFADIPTLAEVGLPGIAVISWWGLIGPKGMPQAIVDKLHAEFSKASTDPELLQRFAAQDLVPFILPQKDFYAMATANQARLGKVIKDLNIKLE